MKFETLLKAPIWGNAIFCLVALLAAIICFIYGVWHNARRLDRIQATTSKSAQITNDGMSVKSRLDSSRGAAHDHSLIQLAWGLLALALLIRGLGSALFLNASLLPTLLFSSILIAVPILVGVALFLLLSPRYENAPAVDNYQDDDYAANNSYTRDKYAANEYSTSADSEGKTPFFAALTKRLRALTVQRQSNALTAFDSFLVGASLAVIGWWIIQELRAPNASNILSHTASVLRSTEAAPVSPSERARAIANVLWFVGAAWIALNWPVMAKTRLSSACDHAFTDVEADPNVEIPRDIGASAAYDARIKSARLQWKTASLRPVSAFLLVGTLLFCAIALLPQATPTTPYFDALLLSVAASCYASAAWASNELQKKHFVDPKLDASTQESPFDAKNSRAEDVNKSDEFALENIAATNRTGLDRLSALSSTRSQIQVIADDIRAQKRRAARADKQIEAARIAVENEQNSTEAPTKLMTARNFLTLLLPCAAAAAGTWHVAHAVHFHAVTRGAVVSNLEIWWGALLVFAASLRHLALNWLHTSSTDRKTQALQHELGTLRGEVTWRTQQLTTLHSVSADLNNTLSNEQVLNTALQRLMEAVRAEAGVVWLLANFDQVAVDSTSRNWNAELRRKEENAAESEDTTSSTRSANGASGAEMVSTSAVNNGVTSRMNLADAADEIVMVPVPNRPLAQSPLAGERNRQSFDAESSDESAKNTASPSAVFNGTLSNGAASENNVETNAGTQTEASAKTPSKNVPFEKPLSVGDLRKSRAVSTSFQNAVRALNGLEDESEPFENPYVKGLAGDGIYVSGPVSAWGDFVSSGGYVDEVITHTSQPVSRVSHTRDTYNIGAENGSSQNGDSAIRHAEASSSSNSAIKNSVPKNPAAKNVAADAEISDGEALTKNGVVASQSKKSSTRNAVFDAKSDGFQGDEEELGFTHRNWRMVRATGYDTPVLSRALAAMNRALEEGGMARCARLSASWFGVIGDVHLAPIRWHGEVVGVLSVTSRQRSFGNADRRLLESLANEVSSALRNAYVYQQARRWAERDGVTNLFNHRAMQEKIGQEMLRARNTKTEMTVVMMDLNNFKFFNDTYGHPVGDGVLVTVAQCLRECCRASDIVGRYGGDEFIVLLPNSNAQDALAICRRIEESVEQQSYGEGGGEERRIPIGLSFGTAVYPHDGRTPLELLTAADANLYDAKRGGSPLAQMKGGEEKQELRLLKDAGVGGSFGVLDALVTAIDNKDQYTRRHSEDVTHWAVLMGKELGFPEEALRTVRISGLLHDVGKIAVPDSILRKPGRLNDDEFAILQQHPVFGALIVKDVPNLPEVLGGIRHHHERFDGKGYPDRLQQEEIPMLGRLLAVPDCFSAMTTNRPYRKALTWSEAVTEIERGSGTQFDPQMTDAFLEVIARIVSQQDNFKPKKKTAENSLTHAEEYPSAYAS